MASIVRALFLAAGISLLSGLPVAATRGVSIDVGSIVVRQQLSPGAEYSLPAFGIRNPGTEHTSYVIGVSYVDRQTALRPPDAWFRFRPTELALQPGDSLAVNAWLELPADAEPGAYAALIGPQVVGDATGAQVGAGAAARLSFTVLPSSAWDAWLRWLWRTILTPEVWIVGVLAVLALAVVAMRRRFTLSIKRRP